MQEFKIKEGSRLKCDDFLQNYEINITITEMGEEEGKLRDNSGVFFEIIGDRSQLNPKEEITSSSDNKDEASTSAAASKKGFFNLSLWLFSIVFQQMFLFS